MFALWLFWFVRLLYGMSPYFWIHGDLQRSLREWRFWFIWSFYAHDYKNDFKALRDYYIYPEDFPDFTKDTPIEFYVVTNENVTREIVEKTWWRGEGVLLWKNAAKDAHLPMQDLQWVRDNFDMEQYYEGNGDLESYQYYNDSNWDTAYEYPMWGGDPVKMQDFVDHTLDGEHKPYYLGFNFKMCAENPKIRQSIVPILDRAVEIVAGPDYYTSKLEKLFIPQEGLHYILEFFFMYYGTQGYANIHNAVMDDTFIQIANTKRWVFVHPRYFPYMHMTYKNFGAAQFLDFEEIPKIWVDVGPGDLLYFPPSYIHTVLNLEEKFGMGLGIRDLKKTILTMFGNLLFGSRIEANVGAFYSQFFQLIKAKITGFDLRAESDKRSALEVFQPKQVYDAWQLEQWHKHIADCHNKFEHLFNPEVKRGVEYGRGRGHPDSPFGPGMAKVMNATELQAIFHEKLAMNRAHGGQSMQEMAAKAAKAKAEAAQQKADL